MLSRAGEYRKRESIGSEEFLASLLLLFVLGNENAVCLGKARLVVVYQLRDEALVFWIFKRFARQYLWNSVLSSYLHRHSQRSHEVSTRFEDRCSGCAVYCVIYRCIAALL